MIFLSLRVTADAEGGLKNRAHLRPVLQGFGGGQPPTSTRRVYTGALLAATLFVRSHHRHSCICDIKSIERAVTISLIEVFVVLIHKS